VDRTTSGRGEGYGNLGAGERMTAVTTSTLGKMADRLVVSRRTFDVEAPRNQLGYIVFGQGLQPKQRRP